MANFYSNIILYCFMEKLDCNSVSEADRGAYDGRKTGFKSFCLVSYLVVPCC